MPALVSPARSALVPDWNASIGPFWPPGVWIAPGRATTGGVTSPGVRVPSKAKADAMPSPATNSANGNVLSDIRIARLLGRSTRMGDGSLARWPHLLREFPDAAGPKGGLTRAPLRPPAFEF